MTEGDAPIKVLVVDDEARARRLIRTRLEELGGYEVVGEAATGEEAAALIREMDPGLVILDIQMPRGTGVEVFESVGTANMPPTIFVTAYDEFAVKAFELHAVDYLLKPFSAGRFEEALSRAREKFDAPAQHRSKDALNKFLDYFSRANVAIEDRDPESEDDGYLRRVVVTSSEPWQSIETHLIDWIEAEDHFVRIHAGKDSYLVAGKISDFEEQLDPTRFLRIHRSTIVNLSSMRRMARARFGAAEVVLTDGTRLRVSRARRDEVKLALIRREKAGTGQEQGASDRPR